VEHAAGFSLNVSNFATTADNQAYGDQLSVALGEKQYVIDVSRDGEPPAGQFWPDYALRLIEQRP
jgi:endoglucanase